MPVSVLLAIGSIYTVYVCLDIQRMMREQLWEGFTSDLDKHMYILLSVVIVLHLLSIPFWLAHDIS